MRKMEKSRRLSPVEKLLLKNQQKEAKNEGKTSPTKADVRLFLHVYCINSTSHIYIHYFLFHDTFIVT
jgi:hypothetical protein